MLLSAQIREFFNAYSMQKLNFYTDYCICGSGKLLKDCCLSRRNRTRPYGDRTSFSHPKCFASLLEDCSEQLSREHYISRGIFKIFGKANNIDAEGFPWIPKGEYKQVSAETLTGKMLCKRHNETLSPLDNLAIKFFEFFVRQEHSNEVEILLINGCELERWFLKTLCGAVASGNADWNGGKFRNWKPPLEWLNILFDEENISYGSGLHFVSGNYSAQVNHLGFNPIFKTSTGQPIALTFYISGIMFLFSMEPPPDLVKPTTSGAFLKYRPKAIQLAFDNHIREAHFGWPDGSFVSVNVRQRG